MVDELAIILQVGGNGRRLHKYTRNCPKSLVSVGNSTLAERNLDILYGKFPNSKYFVIADEKACVLENYFHSYPHPSSPVIITPDEKGTLSGLRAAVELAPNIPILLVWCDLLLATGDITNLATLLSDRNIIGLSNSFDCRWSYSSANILEEVTSNRRGVAGLFYFPDLSGLATQIPLSGEFVKWLSSLHSYNPDVFFFDETRELGDIKSYEDSFIYNKSRERFFNRVSFDGDLVRKECIVSEFAALIENEITWYNYVNQRGYEFSPGLYSEKPLTIDFIKGTHPDQLPASRCVVSSCIDALFSLHSLGEQPFNECDIYDTYIRKTCERIERVRSLLPIEKENLLINGASYSNPFHSKNYDSFVEMVKTVLDDTNVPFVPIHGDSTFSNMLWSSEQNKVYLIDPRGRFGSSSIFGDPYYDFAKLLYSVQGSYDSFNRKDFELISYSDSEFYLSLPSSNYNKYSSLIYDAVASKSRLELIHSLIWFSLAGYVKDHIDSIIGSFLKGVLTFHDFKRNVLELSSLPKTWLLDVDGTLVKHNGHLQGDPLNESFLPGVSEFLSRVSLDDTIILLSARESSSINHIVRFIKELNPSLDVRVCGSLGVGERILVNDAKPSGLRTALSLNCERDKGLIDNFVFIDPAK